MTNFIESIKEGFSVIKEELEELDRRTDFNRLFLDVSVPYRGATFLNTIPATPCPVWDE